MQIPAIVPLIEKRKQLELKEAKNQNKRDEVEKNASPKPIGFGFYPDLAAKNNSILVETQLNRDLNDSEKAVFLVSLMNFAFGGKRIEKNLDPFTPDYKKSSSAKSAPSIGNYNGYLHSYLIGACLLETLWLNLFTKEQIDGYKFLELGIGIPPWEEMPIGEDCSIAKRLKKSYMSCLVSMSRFVYFKDNGVYYVEGIQYPNHKDGWREPSIAFNDQSKKVKVLWVNPEKRPWRELTSLLSLSANTGNETYCCEQIRSNLSRARDALEENMVSSIGLWSGGLKVTSNSGDQSVKQGDDFVESLVELPLEIFGKQWFGDFKAEVENLEKLAKKLYGSILKYFNHQKLDGKDKASQAGILYWQLCERNKDLLLKCNVNDSKVKARKYFAKVLDQVYDTICPKENARQLDAWASGRSWLNKISSIYKAGKEVL